MIYGILSDDLFDDYFFIQSVMDRIIKFNDIDVEEIVSVGECAILDMIKKYANQRCIQLIIFSGIYEVGALTEYCDVIVCFGDLREDDFVIVKSGKPCYFISYDKNIEVNIVWNKK